jgi:hypothetical protein
MELRFRIRRASVVSRKGRTSPPRQPPPLEPQGRASRVPPLVFVVVMFGRIITRAAFVSFITSRIQEPAVIWDIVFVPSSGRGTTDRGNTDIHQVLVPSKTPVQLFIIHPIKCCKHSPYWGGAPIVMSCPLWGCDDVHALFPISSSPKRHIQHSVNSKCRHYGAGKCIDTGQAQLLRSTVE